VLVNVCVSPIAFQREGLPLAEERSFRDAINEGMTTFMWVCWYGMSDSGWEGHGVVMWRHVVCWEDMCMVGWKGRCVVGHGEGVGRHRSICN